MSEHTGTRNPFKERQALLDDMRAARVAEGTLRAEVVRIDATRRAAEEEAFEAEMEVVIGAEGAADRRDAALARLRAAESAQTDKRRGLEAAAQVIKLREGQLAMLHDDDEAFEHFVREAESATAGAERELRALSQQVGRAAQAWHKATARWRPLNPALRRRLDQVNEREGRIENTAPQAIVPPFPLQPPSTLATASPRPLAVNRLRAAGKL